MSVPLSISSYLRIPNLMPAQRKDYLLDVQKTLGFHLLGHRRKNIYTGVYIIMTFSVFIT